MPVTVTAAAVLSTVLSDRPALISMDTGRCDRLLTQLLYGCILLRIFRFGAPRRAFGRDAPILEEGRKNQIYRAAISLSLSAMAP